MKNTMKIAGIFLMLINNWKSLSECTARNESNEAGFGRDEPDENATAADANEDAES